jgi:myo-inositol-1-phosphate synthase
VIDAIRCVKLAMDRGIAGALSGPAAYFMKSPPEQLSDHDARVAVDAFINGSEVELPLNLDRPAAHPARV